MLHTVNVYVYEVVLVSLYTKKYGKRLDSVDLKFNKLFKILQLLFGDMFLCIYYVYVLLCRHYMRLHALAELCSLSIQLLRRSNTIARGT